MKAVSPTCRRLGLSAAFFLMVLTGMLLLARDLTQPWREITRFAAVFPAIWVGYEAARLMGRLDELQRRIALEALTFSLANTALGVLALGLLQPGPYGLNILWALPIMLAFGLLGLQLTRRRYQ